MRGIVSIKNFTLKNPQMLSELWGRIPDSLENLSYIVDNCNIDLELGKLKIPKFKVSDNRDVYSYLWQLAFDGLENRYSKITVKIRDRLKYELEVISELNLTDYFLIAWDIVREAKQRGMMSIGRGSAANSLVSYCLGFTEVDPIKYDLYFERLLNRNRSSLPDIDMDFSWQERDQLVKYVFNKYGYDRVAMISTHVTIQARSAFREVAKAFGISNAEISEKSKYIPWIRAMNLPNLSNLYPESRSLGFDQEPWKTIVEVACRLGDSPRHLSIHPCGLVISPNPITTYTALEYAKNKGIGIIVTQPDMHGIEDLGLIKIDLLSQRSLGVLRDTILNIELNNYDQLHEV